MPCQNYRKRHPDRERDPYEARAARRQKSGPGPFDEIPDSGTITLGQWARENHFDLSEHEYADA